MPYERKTPNYFTGHYLDRNAWEREAADWLSLARSDPNTRYVLARGTTHLIRHEPAPGVVFLDAADPFVERLDDTHAVLLGWIDGVRCVLIETDEGIERAEGRFEELRPLSALLPEREASLLAYARALTIWRQHHRYCGVCGAPTRPRRAGHVLACTNEACGREVFPRLDPAVIVLVTDGERALLGRQASWPPNRYSTIAGFVEPGESIEAAVAREVFEETGVRVGDVTYHSSQPWPFPSSLMLGFHATAASTAITHHDAELDDARWFTRDQIAAGQPLLPPRTSISYRLIESWFDADYPQPLDEVSVPQPPLVARPS